jgi:hypothetical protein
MAATDDGDDVPAHAYKFADELFQIIGNQTDLELPDQATVLISVLIGVVQSRVKPTAYGPALAALREEFNESIRLAAERLGVADEMKLEEQRRP